jgi:DNA-binding Lrp family transcriptional regulator
MKERMRRLLLELLRNSKRSDRELAKVLGISQPTVTRMRNALMEEGVVKEYTVMPNFAEMGYEIMAVTIAKARLTLTPEEQETAKKLVLENPQVIFVASA